MKEDMPNWRRFVEQVTGKGRAAEISGSLRRIYRTSEQC